MEFANEREYYDDAMLELQTYVDRGSSRIDSLAIMTHVYHPRGAASYCRVCHMWLRNAAHYDVHTIFSTRHSRNITQKYAIFVDWVLMRERHRVLIGWALGAHRDRMFAEAA